MSEERGKAYAEAGVNLDAANALVGRIKSIVSATHVQGVISDIGGFGGLFKPDLSGVEEPVLVASTDGVGTKVKLATAWNSHATIGIDLVAMSANDILVQGAKPLFFLDYFATGKLEVEVAETVVQSVADGCKLAACALLGGETAEMPDVYPPGEYDLAGFCVGLVDNANIVDGSGIRVGDQIIGLASSGIHSNGYSLVRKILDKSGLGPDDPFPGQEGALVREVLLEPTAIYVKPVRNVLRDFEVRGMVHVTGGGFYDNLPRILSPNIQAQINFGSWPMPPVFSWLKEVGKLSWPEMLQIFNSGIGYILVVDKEIRDDVLVRLEALKQDAWVIGEIALRKKDQEQVDVVFPDEESC